MARLADIENELVWAWRRVLKPLVLRVSLCLHLLWACTVAAGETPPVLFHCDFDTDAWPAQWGVSRAPEQTQLVDADPERKFEPLRGRALRVRVEKGSHYGVSLAFPFQKRLGYEPEEVYFRM